MCALRLTKAYEHDPLGQLVVSGARVSGLGHLIGAGELLGANTTVWCAGYVCL